MKNRKQFKKSTIQVLSTKKMNALKGGKNGDGMLQETIEIAYEEMQPA